MVDAIVQAARKILTEQGAGALNTNRVAEVAGVNIASLYRWFPNKEAIIESAFEALVNEELEELLALLTQRDADLSSPPSISLEQAIGFIVDPLINRQLRFLALHPDYYQQHQEHFNLGKRGVLGTEHTWIGLASEWMAAVIAHYHPALSPEDCTFRAFMLTRTIQGACLAAATDQPALLKMPRFREELFALAHFCLRSPEASR